MTSSFQGFVLCGMIAPAWLQRISSAQLLPVQLLVHCSLRRLRLKPSVLHPAPYSPAMLGGAPQSLLCAAFLLVQLDPMDTNCAFDLASLLAEMLCVCTGSLPSHATASLLKKKSLCGTHTIAPIHCLAPCTLYLPKRQKLSLGWGWPLTVLGDRISLLNSPGWHCSYGRAAHCV